MECKALDGRQSGVKLKGNKVESWDVKVPSFRGKVFHVILETRNPVQEGTQVVEAPVPSDRRAHTHVAHEVELAAGAPSATCQGACLQCCIDISFPESNVSSTTVRAGTDCDKVDDALADLGWDEPLPDPS